MRPKRTPKPPFSPALRLPASTRSSAKTRPGPASGASAWRLSAAAASVRRAGRTEDEAALRDAFHLSRPGGDPGPAGRLLLAWRELAGPPDPAVARPRLPPPPRSRGSPRRSAGKRRSRRPRPAPTDTRPAPFAAAHALRLARRALTSGAGRRRRAGRGGRAAGGLARRCRARAAAELAVRAAPARRAVVRRRAVGAPAGDVADGAETTRVVFAYAKGAAHACDLAAELARRAQKLADGRAETARQRGRGRAAGAARRGFARRRDRRIGGHSPSAERGGCSTGWSRSARSAN